MSGHCGANVSCQLILCEGQSTCGAVFDAGWVCAFGVECECLARSWELCVKRAVGEPLSSGVGLCIVGHGRALRCNSAYCEATKTPVS